MTALGRIRLYRLTNRFLQSQVREWRRAHHRWSDEKLRLEALADDLCAIAGAAENENRDFRAALNRIAHDGLHSPAGVAFDVLMKHRPGVGR